MEVKAATKLISVGIVLNFPAWRSETAAMVTLMYKELQREVLFPCLNKTITRFHYLKSCSAQLVC